MNMNGREFPAGARGKLLALLSAPAPLAVTPPPQELWAGVLGVVLEGAKAQKDWDLATALVRAGAELEALDLHAVVEEDQPELAAALLERGASVNEEGEMGRTPLFFAAQQGREEMTQLLLQKGADAEKPGAGGTTPAFMAALGGSATVVRMLVAAGAECGLRRGDFQEMSPLGRAVSEGHVDVVRAMVELGVDVNAADRNGRTALCVAKEKVMVDILVEAGAAVDARAEDGNTPLFYASSDISAARALVDHGAEVNAKNLKGDTPLHRLSRHAARKTSAAESGGTLVEVWGGRDDSQRQRQDGSGWDRQRRQQQRPALW